MILISVVSGMRFDDRDALEEALADSAIAWGWWDHPPVSSFDVEIVQTEDPNLADLAWVVAAFDAVLGMEEKLAVTFRDTDERQATYDLGGRAPDLVRAAHDDFRAGATGLRSWDPDLGCWATRDRP